MLKYPIELFSSSFQCHPRWNVLVQLDLDSSNIISNLVFNSNIYAPLGCLMKNKSSKSEWSRLWPSKVTQDVAVGHPIIWFPVNFNSKIWPISAPLRHISISRSCKVKCDCAKQFSLMIFCWSLRVTYGLTHIFLQSKKPWNWHFKVTKVKSIHAMGLPYGFPLLFNSNTWPVLAPLRK